MRRRFAEAAAVRSLTVLGVVLALLSAWHSGGHVWRTLKSERAIYAQMTPDQRSRLFISNTSLPPDVFDFYRPYLTKGDRVYYQVSPSGLSSFFTLEQIVEAVGRFYLLPSTQTGDLNKATVVVSFEADPGLLHRRYVTQQRAGLREFFVSRLK